jgi:hypothetical protein
MRATARWDGLRDRQGDSRAVSATIWPLGIFPFGVPIAGVLMKNSLFLLLMLALLNHGVPGVAATLQNTDSQSYELQIQESGRPYDSHYRIIEHAKVEICFYGCQMVLLSTGQTATVNPDDSVLISRGVMYVTPGR